MSIPRTFTILTRRIAQGKDPQIVYVPQAGNDVSTRSRLMRYNNERERFSAELEVYRMNASTLTFKHDKDLDPNDP